MFPRLVLALVFAALPFLGLVARSVDNGQVFTLVIRMAATRGGLLEVFPDDGSGYRASTAVSQTVHSSAEPYDYKLGLSAGAYSSLRIDPGTGPGIYTIERLAVLDSGGAVFAELPLADLAPTHQLNLVERTATRLVVECPPGANDPQLIYTPSSPLRLTPAARGVGSLARWYFLYVAVGFALLWVTQLAVGRVAPAVSRRFEAIARSAAAHPQIAVMVTALAATLIAMYPVLFLGRSLVSPNDGGVVMLYDEPPFVPSSSDFDVEDVRESDVGAMLWAFVPYSRVQHEALASGELPLWNRYNGPGRSLWGQGQSFLLDPLHWLTLMGPDPAPGWDLKFAAHRFVFAWGIGVAALAATGAWLPAAVAASMAPFAGVYAFRLNHPATFALSYAPWLLAGWFLLSRAAMSRRQAGASVLIAVASTLVLVASPPKDAAVMLATIEATGLVALLLQIGIRPKLLRPLGYAIAAGVAAALVTMPHWLIFLQTLRASMTNYDVPAVLFATRRFAQGLILGPMIDGVPTPSLHALALPFLVAAVLTPTLLLRHRTMLACVIAAAGAIAVAFGAVPADVLVRIPLVANIHAIHTTFLTTALVPLLVLSAAGIEALLQGARTRAAIVTLGTLLASMWVFNGVGGATTLGSLQGWLAFGALAGAALVPMMLLVVTRGFPRVLPLAATAALGLMLMAPGGEHLETGIRALDHILVQPRPRVPLGVSSPAVDGIHAQAGNPVRAAGVGQVMFPGTQALYGLEGLGGPDALFLRSSNELLSVGPTTKRDWAFFFLPADLTRDATLLDMMNVGYLLTRLDDAQAIGPSDRTSEPDLIRAIPRRTAWPRAFFIDRVGTYTTPDELVGQARDAGQPIASILAGDTTAAEITRELSAGPADPIPATHYELTTNTTTFRVQAPHAGVAVLDEAYMPDDFVATLNGEVVPYFRVNHAFKGVAIPGEGEWEVRFEYRPKNWTLALAAAAAGVLILAGLAVAAVRP